MEDLRPRTGELEQYRFLIALDDAIRPLIDPEEITRIAARMLGEFLQVNRCAYAYVESDMDSFVLTGDYNFGVPSIVGRYTSSSFGAAFLRLSRLGVPYVVEDAEADERLADVRDAYRQTQIRAVVSIPLVKAGRFLAGMAVHQKTPRRWTEGEITLVSMVANRCWESIERNRVARELRANENRYRTLVESTSSVVWHARADGALFREDPSWQAFTGQQFDEYIGWGWLAAVHSEDREQVRAFWMQAAGAGSASETGFRLRRHDGIYRQVQVRAVPIREESDDAIAEWICSCSDITERMQVEAERTHFVSLAERSIDFISLADIALRPFFINPAGLKMVGLGSMDEARDVPVREYFFPEDQAFVLDEFIPRAMREGHAETELRFRHFRTGDAIWMNYAIYVLYDKLGNKIGHATVSRNITERLRMEKDLRHSQAHLQSLFEQTAAGICEVDLRGRIMRVNERYCRILGRRPEEIIGRTMQEMTHPGDLARNLPLFENIIATGGSFEIEKRYLRPDGSVVWVSNTVSLIRKDSHGEADTVLAVVLDVTERKRAEEAVRQADRRKDEFLAMLAHELRNPLAPIGAAADLLSIADLDPAKVRQTSRIIARQVKHMTGLVDDLLDVSRVTRGLASLDKSDIDIRRVITSAVEQLAPLIEAKRHRLAIDLAAEPAHVLGDFKRLVQITANLLDNAAKYTPDGGNIVLKMEARDGQVILCVSDDGIGIEEQLLPRVFDLFAQASRSADRSQGGLGLGLALVKSLAELHGGQVRCRSAGLGKGSEFILTLPRLAGQVSIAADGNEDIKAAAARKLRILLVDDNVDAAQMLAMLLEASGHEVFVEHTSHRALRQARHLAPDVCLLDIGLPDIDGHELAGLLRAQPETAKSLLIAVTGYGQERDKRDARAAGFDHHLVKPVDLAKLLALLNEA